MAERQRRHDNGSRRDRDGEKERLKDSPLLGWKMGGGDTSPAIPAAKLEKAGE